MTDINNPPAPVVWLAEHARPILLRHLIPASCIESTAVAIDFLRNHGIKAWEAPVQTKVFNAPAWKLFKQGCYGTSPVDRVTWEMLGAWSLGLGFIDTPVPLPGRYGGHLVAMIEGGWLLDLSLDQASRPQKDLDLQPLLIAADLATVAGSQPLFDKRGRVLVYSVNMTPWANSYRTTPAWKHKSLRAKIVAEFEAAYCKEAGALASVR